MSGIARVTATAIVRSTARFRILYRTCTHSYGGETGRRAVAKALALQNRFKWKPAEEYPAILYPLPTLSLHRAGVPPSGSEIVWESCSMQLPDVLFILMGASLAVIVAVLIYAVHRKLKIDEQGNRHLLRTVIACTAILLLSGLGYVLMTAS